MFLATMQMPASGETLALGDAALACCREQLCPKFTSQSDCSWIASGDLSWKERLSDDLDKVQTIDHRLEQLKDDDMDDPSAAAEIRELQAERIKIENSELTRLAKVAPLTAMCDDVLDSDQPADDIAEEQVSPIVPPLLRSSSPVCAYACACATTLPRLAEFGMHRLNRPERRP